MSQEKCIRCEILKSDTKGKCCPDGLDHVFTSSHINKEWEKNLEDYRCSGPYCTHEMADDHYIITKDFVRTLYLQALEQGRTEGSRGDYGRKMYMNGYKEALEQSITAAKNETSRLKAPNEIEREYYEKNTGWEQCQAAIVKELEALSKLREV